MDPPVPGGEPPAGPLPPVAEGDEVERPAPAAQDGAAAAEGGDGLGGGAAVPDAPPAAAAGAQAAAPPAAGAVDAEAAQGVEVRGYTGSLLEAIAEGVVERPELLTFGQWAQWRARGGRRLQGAPAIAPAESALWRSTMHAVYGPDWLSLIHI